MKFLILLLALCSFSASAIVIKSCDTVLKSIDHGKDVPTLMEVIETNGTLSAKVTQKAGNENRSYVDTVIIEQDKVRAGLTPDSEIEGANQAELLVIHAMTMESDPIFRGKFKSGINLKKVRSAKVFTIGEVSNMGSTSIVEARDAQGKLLGSFLGGFLVSPCK